MKHIYRILCLMLMPCMVFADYEIAAPYTSGQTLYMTRYQPNGDVFLSDGLSDEVWGTGGRDADDYDVSLSEAGSSGHYVANFDTLENIGAGSYKFDIFLQTGGSPADSDQPAFFV